MRAIRLTLTLAAVLACLPSAARADTFVYPPYDEADDLGKPYAAVLVGAAATDQLALRSGELRAAASASNRAVPVSASVGGMDVARSYATSSAALTHTVPLDAGEHEIVAALADVTAHATSRLDAPKLPGVPGITSQYAVAGSSMGIYVGVFPCGMDESCEAEGEFFNLVSLSYCADYAGFDRVCPGFEPADAVRQLVEMPVPGKVYIRLVLRVDAGAAGAGETAAGASLRVTHIATRHVG